MKKSSWYALGLGGLLTVLLISVYVLSMRQTDAFTQIQATSMLADMQTAVADKNVSGIMRYVSTDPDTHLAGLNYDQLRLSLNRAFHDSGQLTANVNSVGYSKVGSDVTVDFELKVVHKEPSAEGDDYSGHITFHIQPVQVSHLLGLYRTTEWLIVGVETTGPSPASFGDG